MGEGDEKDRHADTSADALIYDLYYLHKDCKFELSEIDNRVLALAIKLKQGHKIATTAIQKTRADLYLEYSYEMLKELSKYAVDLTDNFADVTSTFGLIDQTLRNLEELDKKIFTSGEALKIAIDSITELNKEYSRLVNEESRLKSEGWKKFLPSLMSMEIRAIFLYVSSIGGLIGLLKALDVSWNVPLYLIVLSVLLYGGLVIWLAYIILKKLHLRYAVPDYINDLIKESEEE